MRELDARKVYVQYRGGMEVDQPLVGRKYTVTHSDTTAELFVFVSDEYAEDQVTELRDEVKLVWEKNARGYLLRGKVVVDNCEITGNAALRNKIFYNEMPTALQAVRIADRFLYEAYPFLDNTHVMIHFSSMNQEYNRVYDFGSIGEYDEVR